MNNIIRFLLKKNVIQDLARVPHNLDLSSPNMAATVNAALKPLETLSRTINLPAPVLGGRVLPTKGRSQPEGTGEATTGTSTGVAAASEATATASTPVVASDPVLTVSSPPIELCGSLSSVGPQETQAASMDVVTDASLADDDINTGTTVTTTTASDATNAILEANIEDITDNTDTDGLALDVSGPSDGLDLTSGGLRPTQMDSSYPLPVRFRFDDPELCFMNFMSECLFCRANPN